MSKLKPLKKTIKLSLTLIMLYGLNACSSKPTTPQEISIAFVNALAKGNFEECKTYTTEATAKVIEQSILLGAAPTPGVVTGYM